MEPLRRLLPKISAPAGSWHCERHDRDVPNEVVVTPSRTLELPGLCQQCAVEQEADREAKARFVREARCRAALCAVGIPERYLGARLEDFLAQTASQQDVRRAVDMFVAGGWQHNSPGMLWLGNIGTGKTMLASALVRLWLIRYGTHAALFCNLLGLLRRIKATWGVDATESETMVLRQLRDVGLLVVDEIGVQHGSPTEFVLFTDLINARYNALRPTILIGNLTVAECTKILGERVIDRFRDGGQVLTFDWPSWRGKTR